MKALRNEVAAELVAGSGGLLISRSAVYLVPKSLAAADQIIDLCGEQRAVLVARMVATNAAGILASGFPIQMGKWVKGPMEYLDLLENDQTNSDAGEGEDVTNSGSLEPTSDGDRPDARDASPPVRKTRRRNSVKLKDQEKDQPAGPVSEEPTVPKQSEVAVSALGLSEDVIDVLYESELGTSKQVVEFDVDKGLESIVGKDTRLDILKAIADKTDVRILV